MPLHAVPEKFRCKISKTNHTIKGVGATPIEIYGYLTSKLRLGSGSWYDVRMTILTRDIPVLIGNDVLRHRSVVQYTVSSENIEFVRKGKKGSYSFKVPIITNPEAYVTLSLPSDLQLKVNRLKSEKKVTLPSGAQPAELRELVDLLEEFSDILATDDSPIGTFPAKVRVHTVEGRACAMKQHPIPEAYRSQVDAEIDKMIAQGVVEPCPDPKGWNTPLHVVKKKSGDLRIVANFKRTVNKLLTSEADFAWQMPSCDEVFNEIGLGNT